MIEKGRLAEAAVRYHLIAAGLDVYDPVGDHHPFDLLVVDPGGRVIKVQVKHGRHHGAIVECNAHSTDHGRGAQTYRGRADVIAMFVPALARSYVVPVGEAPLRGEVRLRLEPPRNGQRRRIRFAEDHTLERWAARVLAGAPASVAA